MIKKDKNIDTLFREKLQDYEQQPSSFILENVLAGVAAARRKRKIIFWRVAGVAAALLLAFVAGWQVNHMNQENLHQPVVVNQNSPEETKGALDSVPEKETISNKNQEVKTTDAETTGKHRVPRFATAEDTSSSETSGKTDSEKQEQLASRISQQEKNRVQRFATAETKSPSKTSDKTDSEKQQQLASGTSQQKKNTLLEPKENTGTQDFSSIQSLETIAPQVGSNDQFTLKLQERKVDNSVIEQPELTLDQQIIEQNQQQMRAQKEKRKNAHWLVGAQVSPAYSVNRSSHSSEYAGNMLNSSSNTPIELGGGLSVEYKPGKRWSLQSGVYYAGLGQSSGNASNANRNLDALANNGAEYFNAPVNREASKMMINSQAGVIEIAGTPTGIVLGTNLEDKSLASTVVVSDARFIQNFQYLEIPLYLRYSVIDARFDVELMGGLSSNVLVGNDTYMESSAGKSKVGKTQDMQDINYSGTFGVGLKYGVSRRIFLNVEPRVKYYLQSLNTNSAVTYKPYTIGVYTGVSYQF